MAIQAIIMAGGEGTRLRPLTLDKPKPLVPVLGEPVMGYTLKLLHRYGLTEVAATLQYLPKMIRDTFSKGEAYGVNLRYLEEASPMGTAGSVRMAKGMVADTFVVMSGDGLTDCNLAKAMAFHQSAGAMATLVLKSVPVPLAYGVVITDERGKVERFVEKPDWSGVFSDQVNTGIYILQKEVMDLIPSDGPYDFGKDLFPRMVREGLPVYGYPMTGYWCDIGDQEAYVKSQLDLLRGEADLPIAAKKTGHAYVAGACFLEPGAVLDGPCYIGEGAIIRKGAVLLEGAVIGPGALVEEGAHIVRSCLWENSRVGRCARLTGAVVCREAVVRPGGRMLEGSALGMGALLGAHAQLNSGVKVWPQKEVSGETIATENLVWGDLKRLHLGEDGGITLESPAQADQLAAACVSGLKITSAALCFQGDGEALYSVLAGALAARGAEVLLLGSGQLALLSTIQRVLSAPLGILAQGQKAYLLGVQGLPLEKSQLKAIEGCALRQEYPPAFAQAAAMIPFSGAEELYLSHLLKGVDTKALEQSNLNVAVFCDYPPLLHLATRLLRKAGVPGVRGSFTKNLSVQPWEIGFLLDDDGAQAYILDSRGMMEETRQQLLAWQTAVREGCLPLFAPPDAPRVIEMLGETRWGRDVKPQTAQEQAAFLRQHDLLNDGLCRMLALVVRMTKDGLPLQSLIDQLPKSHRMQADVPCPPGEKGRILRQLYENARNKELGEGVRIQHGSGSVWLTPFHDRAAFRVQSESFDAEFAGELCNHYAGKIAKLSKSSSKKEEKGALPNVH